MGTTYVNTQIKELQSILQKNVALKKLSFSLSLSLTDDKKTSDDVKKEGEILTEMLEIVAKRDSLISLLEEERQR